MHSFKNYVQTHFIKILAIIFWVLFASSFVFYQSWSGLSYIDMAKNLLQFIQHSPFGILLLLIVYSLRPLLFFPVTIMRVILGALFGFWPAFFLVIIAENLSASVAYGLGRFFGEGLIPLDGKGFLSKWKTRIHKNSFTSVFFLELTFLHFDVVHYFCGIMHTKYIPFLMGSFLGILPGMLGFLSFGASIENLETLDMTKIHIKPEMAMIGFGFIGIGIMLSVWFHLRSKREEKITS